MSTCRTLTSTRLSRKFRSKLGPQSFAPLTIPSRHNFNSTSSGETHANCPHDCVPCHRFGSSLAKSRSGAKDHLFLRKCPTQYLPGFGQLLHRMQCNLRDWRQVLCVLSNAVTWTKPDT